MQMLLFGAQSGGGGNQVLSGPHSAEVSRMLNDDDVQLCMGKTLINENKTKKSTVKTPKCEKRTRSRTSIDCVICELRNLWHSGDGQLVRSRACRFKSSTLKRSLNKMIATILLMYSFHVTLHSNKSLREFFRFLFFFKWNSRIFYYCFFFGCLVHYVSFAIIR